MKLSLAAIGALLARLGLTAQKPLERAYQRDPEAVARWKNETFPAIATEAKSSGAEILFWDESGFRADAVHGKTWAPRGQTPVIERPGQRQSISAASAVSAKGAFWFATYQGGLTGELFVELLKKMMYRRKKPVRLVVDGLPAHKKALVKEYVASTAGKLTLHFLPGYAPDLNPDELVWSHAKRTGVARSPLKAGEKLQCRVDARVRADRRHAARAAVPRPDGGIPGRRRDPAPLTRGPGASRGPRGPVERRHDARYDARRDATVRFRLTRVRGSRGDSA